MFFTGARITSVGQEHLLLTRSGAGAPELQSLGYVNARGGQAPALRARKGFSSPCIRFGSRCSRTTVS